MISFCRPRSGWKDKVKSALVGCIVEAGGNVVTSGLGQVVVLGLLVSSGNSEALDEETETHPYI
jgi:cell shape-determining protein MreC